MALSSLPAQPLGALWPTKDWPEGDLPQDMARARFDALIAAAFAAADTDLLGETHALVIIQGGRLIFERYGPAGGRDVTNHSWSMAKSITQALAGLAVGDGKLDIAAPAFAPEWAASGDPRRAITMDQLLRMSSGLQFLEEYLPDQPSDVIQMLFGPGKEDVARFAAEFPLAHAPGSFWYYSSGTSNIVSRAVAHAWRVSGADYEKLMRERLFHPLGMASATPKFDKAGTFIGSSFCFATARDFAKFGLLYLRDGIWEGRRLLPEGWVDYARTPTPRQETPDQAYGAHWWLGGAGPGSFSANGYDGQNIMIAPDLDLVLVRNGKTPLDKKDRLKLWIAEVVSCFRMG